MKRLRKSSGKKYIDARKKKAFERPGQKRDVRMGEDSRGTKRVLGGNTKVFLKKAKFVNVKTANGIKKVELKNVLETPSNRFLARQNIITRGTIIDSDLGKIRITNRPSQEGVLNGILVG